MSNTEQPSGQGAATPVEGKVSDAAIAEQHIERLANNFEVSARRWELVVYPVMFAFIVLACYGFFLIYNLTHDVRQLSQNMVTLTASIEHMGQNIGTITGDMRQITGTMGDIKRSMVEVSGKMDALDPMRQSMASMDTSTRAMAMSTERMGHEVGALNYNVGRPMGMMGSFMPW